MPAAKRKTKSAANPDSAPPSSFPEIQAKVGLSYRVLLQDQIILIDVCNKMTYAIPYITEIASTVISEFLLCDRMCSLREVHRRSSIGAYSP